MPTPYPSSPPGGSMPGPLFGPSVTPSPAALSSSHRNQVSGDMGN